MAQQHNPHHPSARHQLTSQHWHWAMPLMAAVFGVTVGAGILLTVQESWRRAAEHHEIPAHAQIWGVSEVAETDLYKLSVTSKVATVSEDKAFTPPVGQNIIVLAISVTNKGDVTHPFLPSIHTYVRDDEGETYKMHPSTAIVNPLPASDLAPGQTVSGQVSYAIPASMHNFRLYIDPQWGDMAPVVFRLKR